MTKRLALLCLLLAGCASRPVAPVEPAAITPPTVQAKAKPTFVVPAAIMPPPPLLKAAVPVKRMTPLVIVPPPAPVFLPIIYPADMTNYVWTLQESTNLTPWTDIQTFAQGTNSGTFVITNRPPATFWRMKANSP